MPAYCIGVPKLLHQVFLITYNHDFLLKTTDVGLDISISTDLDNDINEQYNLHSEDDCFYQHSLSRAFCRFMRRQTLDTGSELYQIGRIIQLDISLLYHMEWYSVNDEEKPLYYQELIKKDKEPVYLQEKLKESKERLTGEIDKVIALIDSLIHRLSDISNLHELLDAPGHNSEWHNYYFSDFNADKGDGYISNNFGQDLRNLRRSLEFARQKGARTAYFRYG